MILISNGILLSNGGHLGHHRKKFNLLNQTMFPFNQLYHLDSKTPYKVNIKMLFIAFLGQIGLRELNDGHLGRHL